MNNDFKILMFISSFIPLWLSIILSTIFDNKNAITSWTMFGIMIFLIIISLVKLKMLIRQIRTNITPKKFTIKNAERQKSISSEYLLSYIMPLIAFDFTNLRDILIFLLYITILGYLCIKNHNVYTNIVFEIKGYSFFLCDIEYLLSNQIIKKNVLIISKNDISRFNRQNVEMSFIEIDNDIFIE